jgi:branched-chain amino acid aminotransferase
VARDIEPETAMQGAQGPSPLAEIQDGLAFFGGRIVPFREATVSVATHALHYGTGCFEGIRAYWSPERDDLFVLRMEDHYRRFHASSSMLRITLAYGVEELSAITLDLLRAAGLRQDVYIRPLAFKASHVIKVGLGGLRDEMAILAVPMGDYVNTAGLSVQVSAWQRINDNAIPARSKLTGSYVNIALAADEARQNGYDESLLLNAQGHVAEGSGSNVFVWRRGQLITPPVSEDILEGITRDLVVELARAEGIPVLERPIDRSELYLADEVFLTGTGAQVAPVTRIDGRPVGTGGAGPVTLRIQDRYFRAVRGLDAQFAHWLTPVYAPATSAAS